MTSPDEKAQNEGPESPEKSPETGEKKAIRRTNRSFQGQLPTDDVRPGGLRRRSLHKVEAAVEVEAQKVAAREKLAEQGARIGESARKI